MQDVAWQQLVERVSKHWRITECIFSMREEIQGCWTYKLSSLCVKIDGDKEYNVVRTPFQEFITGKKLSRAELKSKVAERCILGTVTSCVTGFQELQLEKEVNATT